VTSPDVADAVGAVIAAVEEEFPWAEPRRKAELLLAELRRQGWQVVAPGSCRSTKDAVAALGALQGR
jgi:hypothetical protein